MNKRGRLLLQALGILLWASMVHGQSSLAQYTFASAGWATFGLALAPGEAVNAVQVGSFATQTDVKRRWPDGSIRFAVVTTRPTAGGTYDVTSASGSSSAQFAASLPSAVVSLVAGGTTFNAALPSASSNVWLQNGGLVREYRAVVAPSSGGVAHPSLRVIYDARLYNDGTSRLDIAVTNTLNVAATNAVTYDVSVTAAGREVFRKASVYQPSFTRWRITVHSGPTPLVDYLPDPAPFIRAKALPKFLSTISTRASGGTNVWTVSGAGFGILERGELAPEMGQTGGRFELGVRPDFVAQFMVYRTSNQFEAIKYYGGNPAGYWSTHITEADAQTLISLDQKPNFWFDYDKRYSAADGIAGPANGMAGYGKVGDPAHYPSLAFAPYLMTGDRWYLDELKQTANFSMLKWAWRRDGSSALFTNDNQIRGIAWTVRDLADAAAWSPDNDPDRAYFQDKLTRNLVSLDNQADASRDPLGSVEAQFASAGIPPQIPLWQVAYLSWAIDHAHQQGFGSAGGKHLRKWLTYQNNLFGNPTKFDPRYGLPYYFHAAKQDGTFFAAGDWAGLWQYNFGAAAGSQALHPLTDLATDYGAEAWLAMRIALAMGDLPNVQANHDWVMNYTNPTGASVRAKANAYPRFAVDIASLGADANAQLEPPTTITAPLPPSNVRIVIP
jgi:hypothetical protein